MPATRWVILTAARSPLGHIIGGYGHDLGPCEHDTAPPRIALRPQEAAANALGVSLRTIMAMEKAGEIPSVRIGKRNLRFPVDGLRAWVATRTTWPMPMTVPAPIDDERLHQAEPRR